MGGRKGQVAWNRGIPRTEAEKAAIRAGKVRYHITKGNHRTKIKKAPSRNRHQWTMEDRLALSDAVRKHPLEVIPRAVAPLEEGNLMPRQCPHCGYRWPSVIASRTSCPKCRKHIKFKDTRRTIVDHKPRKAVSAGGGRRSVCLILHDHRQQLKDDPDRLSTEFIERLVVRSPAARKGGHGGTPPPTPPPP